MFSLVLWSSFAVIAQISEAQKPVVEKAILAAAVEFYADWGTSEASDRAASERFLGPGLKGVVNMQRRTCRKPGCIDLLTCMPGRAAVLSSTLQTTTLANTLVADVALQGVNGQGQSTARWTLQQRAEGLRLTNVDCVTGTAVIKPPTAATPPTVPTLATGAAPIGSTKVERFARELFREAAAAGDDKRRHATLMMRAFNSRVIADKQEEERECLAHLKSGTDDPSCNHNPFTCTTGAFVIDEIVVASEGMTANIMLRSLAGKRCEVNLYLDETDRLAGYYSARDPDRASKQRTQTGLGVPEYKSPPRGACAGFVSSCSPGCSESGCYRNTVGRCGGAPLPCSYRSRSACHGGCYWDASVP